MSVESAINRIRCWASANNWRPSRFAKEAGLHENTLRGLDSEAWNPTTETLRKLEAVIPAGWRPGDAVPAAAPGAALVLRQAQDEGGEKDGEAA